MISAEKNTLNSRLLMTTHLEVISVIDTPTLNELFILVKYETSGSADFILSDNMTFENSTQ